MGVKINSAKSIKITLQQIIPRHSSYNYFSHAHMGGKYYMQLFV